MRALVGAKSSHNDVVTAVGRARAGAMAHRTVDIKISFPQFSCFPGREAYESFEANLEAHATRCDDEGWSIADCLFRRDAGAVDAAGVPVPTVPAILAVGGGTAMEKQRRLRRKRLKESHGFIMQRDPVTNARGLPLLGRSREVVTRLGPTSTLSETASHAAIDIRRRDHQREPWQNT